MQRMINARCDGWKRLNVYYSDNYEAWFVGRSRTDQKRVIGVPSGISCLAA